MSGNEFGGKNQINRMILDIRKWVKFNILDIRHLYIGPQVRWAHAGTYESAPHECTEAQNSNENPRGTCKRYYPMQNLAGM